MYLYDRITIPSVWFSQLFVPFHKHFLLPADRGLWYADPPQALSRQTLSCNCRRVSDDYSTLLYSVRKAWYGLSPDSWNFHSISLLFSLRTAIGKISLLFIDRHHRRDCFIHLFPLLSHTAIFSCFEFSLHSCSKKILFQEMGSYRNSHGASGFTADCNPADQSVGSP